MERWKPVVGFEGLYEVSDHGRVKSLPKTYTRHEWRHGHEQVVNRGEKILTGSIERYKPTGRPVRVNVMLRERSSGKNCLRRVHRLVLEAFDRPPRPGEECCHNDGDPTNNNLTNLRWGSRTENRADMKKHQTGVNPPVHIGVNHPRSKLNGEKVKEIRCAPGGRGVQAKLARRYGITETHVSRLRKGEGWKHIK